MIMPAIRRAATGLAAALLLTAASSLAQPRAGAERRACAGAACVAQYCVPPDTSWDAHRFYCQNRGG